MQFCLFAEICNIMYVEWEEEFVCFKLKLIFNKYNSKTKNNKNWYV